MQQAVRHAQQLHRLRHGGTYDHGVALSDDELGGLPGVLFVGVSDELLRTLADLRDHGAIRPPPTMSVRKTTYGSWRTGCSTQR